MTPGALPDPTIARRARHAKGAGAVEWIRIGMLV
jgi:hypothetical protein